MEAAEAPAHVWVVDAGDTELDRSERVARRARRQGAEVRALGSRWCVALPEGFDEARWRRRVERRLGRPAEERADCDVAWFPLGRGYAAGMGMTYDSLMAGSGDEPDAAYGLVARAVRVSADRLEYRFLLRPEARFHDGSRLTARDVAFSLTTLKTKGHPVYKMMLAEMDSASAEADDD